MPEPVSIYFLLQAGEVAAAVAAVGGIVYSTWRWLGVRWLFERFLANMRRRKQFMVRAERVFDIVERELTVNGGGSMRDKVAKFDMRQMLNDARVRALMQASQLAVFETDPNGSCIYVSRSLCRLVEFSYDELLGDGWHNMICVDDRERLVKSWSAAVAARREFSEVAECRRPDKTSFKAQLDGYVMRSDSGSLGYIVTVQLAT